MLTRPVKTLGGRLFLVVAALTEQSQVESLQKKLEKVEKNTHKNLLKWTKSSSRTRIKYLLELTKIKELKKTIFYSIYHDSKEYISLTSLTVAKAILSQQINLPYSVNIVIDGLKEKEMEKVRRELKMLKINYRKIRGMKDEQDSILRLTDCIAGFLRDCYEKKKYVPNILRKFEEGEIITEV